MKKLMITTVLVLGGLTTTMAQEAVSLNPVSEVTEIVASQDYVAIELQDVPKPVLEALAVDFKNARIEKAWKNAKEEYKIELVSADSEVLTVHANKKGEWIKKG